MPPIKCRQIQKNVGRMKILPAAYIGNPRHMHEYVQDAMTHVRQYGKADSFVTFTCNPKWMETKQELFPGQSPIDRHDIAARVFRQKLKPYMDFIVKRVWRQVLLDVFCGVAEIWVASSTYILIWLNEK